MKRISKYIAIAVLAVLLAGCGGRKASQDNAFHPVPFPAAPTVPSIIKDGTETTEYVMDHFWDAFLGRNLPCDTNIVNGVLAGDVESAVGTYLTVLEQNCGLDFARKAVGNFFGAIERFQAADTSSNVFGFFEKTISRYLYDPNSPVRNEDLYLPFVKGLSESPFVPEGMRQAYAHDASMCSLNQAGTVATDFIFTDLGGRRHSLHSVKADHTLLFFSNPGCPACKEIIDGLTGDPRITGKISSGKGGGERLYRLRRGRVEGICRKLPFFLAQRLRPELYHTHRCDLQCKGDTFALPARCGEEGYHEGCSAGQGVVIYLEYRLTA